jgi:hypothetical protein
LRCIFGNVEVKIHNEPGDPSHLRQKTKDKRRETGVSRPPFTFGFVYGLQVV